MRRRAAAVALAAGCVLGTAACTAAAETTIQPRDGRSGLQGTGTIEGRQVAVATGLPQLVVGDCDPPDGRDDDVCIVADTIDGRLFVLAFENPAVLVPGETLPVSTTPCADPEACDAVDDGVVVTVKLEADAPLRATGGTVTVEAVEPFTNYVGSIALTLPDGRFNGSFDVVPRPE